MRECLVVFEFWVLESTTGASDRGSKERRAGASSTAGEGGLPGDGAEGGTDYQRQVWRGASPGRGYRDR